MSNPRYAYHPSIDIRQLRTFLTVAEVGSINKASERLFTAQPALSRQIRMLEEELGVQLFERHGRGMAITPAGLVLQQRAEDILSTIETVRTEVAAAAGRMTGVVRLGFTPTVGLMLGGRLIRRYCDAYPEVILDVAEEMSGHLLDWLHQGRIDIAVIYNPPSHRDLRITPLLREHLFLVGPPSASLSLRTPVSVRDYAEQPFILPSHAHGLRELVEDTIGPEGIKIRVRMETDSYRIQKEAVANGLGFTILPYAAMHDEVRSGALRAAPIKEPRIIRSLVVATNSTIPMKQATQKLREMLLEETTFALDAGLCPALEPD
jgi:LysR family nitrogen assimilation transcriptional regulator